MWVVLLHQHRLKMMFSSWSEPSPTHMRVETTCWVKKNRRVWKRKRSIPLAWNTLHKEQHYQHRFFIFKPSVWMEMYTAMKYCCNTCTGWNKPLVILILCIAESNTCKNWCMSLTAALGQGENFLSPLPLGLHNILDAYTTLRKSLISQVRCQKHQVALH